MQSERVERLALGGEIASASLAMGSASEVSETSALNPFAIWG